MNDYLANLSMRSFDLAGNLSIVRPRLPSLFEPSQESPGIWDGALQEAETSRNADLRPATVFSTNDGKAPINMDPITAKRNRKNQSHLSDSNSATRPHKDLTDPPLVTGDKYLEDSPLRSVISQLNASTPEHLIRPSQKISAASETIQKAESGMEDKNGLPQPPTRSRESEHDHKSEAKMNLRLHRIAELPRVLRKNSLTVKRVRVKEGNTDPAKRTVSLLTEKEDPDSPPGTRQDRVIHPVANPVLWKEKKDSPNAQESREPTIHVTIGRIEVRAIAPTAKTRSKPKSPVAMSLEEYLRHRTGGRD